MTLAAPTAFGTSRLARMSENLGGSKACRFSPDKCGVDTRPDGGAVQLAEAELKARKREIRELKRQIEGRPLDSWERYRALRDVLGQSYDLIEISNREARLALMLMGALNA